VTKPQRFRPYRRYGWGWREKRVSPGRHAGAWRLQHQIKIELTDIMRGDVEAFISNLRSLMIESGVEEPEIIIDLVSGAYGDRDRDTAFLVGWKFATLAEIDEKEAELDRWEKVRRENEEQQIAHLRKTRPELFKE